MKVETNKKRITCQEKSNLLMSNATDINYFTTFLQFANVALVIFK